MLSGESPNAKVLECLPEWRSGVPLHSCVFPLCRGKTLWFYISSLHLCQKAKVQWMENFWLDKRILLVRTGDCRVSCSCCSVAKLCPILQPRGLQHARLPYLSLSPGAFSNSCPLSQWCHPIISSSVVPFSWLQSFPASGSFPMNRLFTSGCQSTRVSASTSVLPMNIQDWFPLGWTGWISLQSKGLSRVFSNTTVQKHQFFALSLLYGPTLKSIHDYYKNHSFDYTDLCQKSNISAF